MLLPTERARTTAGWGLQHGSPCGSRLAPAGAARRRALHTRCRVCAAAGSSSSSSSGSSSSGSSSSGSSSSGSSSSGSGGQPAPIAQSTCRLRMTVAYDGSNFAGFQFQTPKVRTVQGELEKAAARVLLPAGRVVGASRTDGGAHARGNVAHLDVAGSADGIQPDNLLLVLNGLLPEDVKLRRLELAPPGFDSHFSSVGKEYSYKLSCSAAPDPLQSRQCWWVYSRWCEGSRGQPQSQADLALDTAAMAAAAQLLVGRHDFSTFMDNKKPAGLGALKRKKPKLAELAAAGIKPVRTAAKNTRLLWRAEVQQEATAGDVTIRLAGNGFLYRMVRMIAAALVEVGHGRLSVEAFQRLMERGDRSAFRIEAAPPHGLCLEQVLYELPPGVDAAELAAVTSSSNEHED